MDKTTLACLWAATILVAALAASFGLIGEGMADGLYFGLLMGAGVSLSQAPCGSC